MTQDERCHVHALKRQNISLGRIAVELQRDHSTISRKLKRNIGATGYKPFDAHEKARTRQTVRRNTAQFCCSEWAHVDAYFRLHLSPQQCSGRLKLKKTIPIGHERINKHIYRAKNQGSKLVQVCKFKMTGQLCLLA